MGVVVISGSSGDLGQALAADFLAAGNEVVGLDLRRRGPHGLLFLETDLRDADAIDAAFSEIARRAGPVSVLVNNAGVVSGKGFLEVSATDLDLTLRQHPARWPTSALAKPLDRG